MRQDHICSRLVEEPEGGLDQGCNLISCKAIPGTCNKGQEKMAGLTQSRHVRVVCHGLAIYSLPTNSGCMQAGMPVCMLTEQYRMHPSISAWPSQYFYKGLLVDAESVQGQGKAAKFHQQRCFQPLMLYDCRWSALLHLLSQCGMGHLTRLAG